MTPIINLVLLTATIISALGIIYIIYSRSVTEISRKLYILALILVMGYLISHFVHFLIMPSEDVTILDHSCHSFLLLIILVLTFFSYYFHSSKDMSILLKLFLLAPSAILMVLIWTGNLVESSHAHVKRFEAHYGPYYASYLIWYVLLLFMSIYFLIKKTVNSKSKLIKKQILIVLLGLIITNLTAFVFGLYLPWILGFYYLVEISPLAFFIGVILTTTIAISRFDMFPAAVSRIQSFSLNKKVIFSAVIVVPVIILLFQIPLGRVIFRLETTAQWQHYFIMSLFGGILVSSAMAFLISKIIANPINKLIDKTNEIQKGNYGIKVDIYSNDELGKLAATFNDMSSTLKKDTEELEIKQKRIQMLLNAFEKSNAAICAFDFSGNIIELNSEFSKILHSDKNELSNGNIFEKIEARTELNELLQMLRQFNRKDKIENEIKIFEGGDEYNYLISISPFYIDSGEPSGYLLIGIDITKIKQLEAELGKAEKLAALGKMAAVLTHEIKTPLTSIKMNTDMLAESLKLDDDDKNSMNIIKKEINRLNNLVKEVLQFSRQINIEKERFNIKDLFDEIIRNTRTKFDSRNFVIINNCENNEIYADKEKLHQVFLNLIENAFESSKANGKLSIESEQKDGRLKLTFIDNGTGVPKDLKENIFEPFFTTKASGTGLGLAVAQRIVELHDGEIKLVSSRAGETVFDVILKQNGNSDG